MNERFIELYEQASDIEREQEIAKPSYSDRVIMRFAEMIVKECAKSANDWYQNHDKIHSDPMSYVLAHFGVEE